METIGLVVAAFVACTVRAMMVLEVACMDMAVLGMGEVERR